MKIFALNLCLEFDLAGHSPRTDAPVYSSSEWLPRWKYIDPQTTASCTLLMEKGHDAVEALWALQANDDWRAIDISLRCLFEDEAQMNAFLQRFQSRFRPKLAAGGIVENEQGAFLAIYTRNRWTFPKGHVEEGESIPDAGIREVQEETGLKTVSIVRPLCNTLHTFRAKKKWKLKTTHWYLMKGTVTERLLPQEEEHIEAVEWVSPQQWEKIKHTFYPQNRWLFEQVIPPESTL
ncbi:MAG: NUDIX domain-containing protein [Bacteroidota bacterium]